MDTTETPTVTESARSEGLSRQHGQGKVITLSTLTPREDGSKPIFRIHKERVVIGSVVSADVRLSGDGIAPIHAVLELNPDGEGTIYDLASETGVFVNGARIVTQRIQAGDKVRIGGQEFQFNVDELENLMQERSRESEGRKLFLDANEDFSPLLLEDERHVAPIFDYRPAQKRALEVVMSWFGTILDVEHFVREKNVTIGTGRKSHFGIPPLLTQKHYAIVTRSSGGFVLNLDPQMKGVLQRKGKLLSMDEVRAEMRAGSAVTQVPLSDEDFAKVSVGDVDFYLSFTAAPPRLKMSRLMERDPLFLKVLLASVLFSGAVVGGLVSTYQPKPIDAEEIPERLATILYEPEKFERHPVPIYQAPTHDETPKVNHHPVPPKPIHPKPQKTVKVTITPHHHTPIHHIPKEMHVTPKPVHSAHHPIAHHTGGGHNPHQSMAREGEGARAHGKEGLRGERHGHVNSQHQSAALRTSAHGGVGRGGGNSQVQNVGNVDILKAATGKIEDILGNTAQKLGKNGERLKGFGGFSTQGDGGLALSGKGNGGGGTANSLGGLGKKGVGGGRVGTGKGAAGTGRGIIGGMTRVAIRTGGPEEAVVMGSIDADAIEAAMLAHRDEFRKCYEQEIRHDAPAKGGRVGTTFVIGSSGHVTHAAIESTTLHIAGTENCILQVIRRIDFPIPRGAGVVQVNYPFKFNPVGDK